jgi:hypothetical protein
MAFFELRGRQSPDDTRITEELMAMTMTKRPFSLFALALLMGAARYAAAQAGALDPTFGNNGIVALTTPTRTLNAVAIQSDGKIVAAGNTLVGQGFESGTGGYVARYLAQ